MAWSISNAMMKAYENSNCSREPVAESLADSCLGMKSSVQSSITPTPDQYYWPDKTTEHSRLSRFGMTCEPLMADRGEALLTWFRAGFPVRTLAPPAKVQESMASEAECGQRWYGSFARYDLAASAWKTVQCSLVEGLDEYSEIWPRWGSMRNGVSFLQPIPALPICASESGLWQTPVADDAVNRARGKWNSRGEPKLSAQVLNWPTPRARDAQPEGLEAGRRRVEKYSTCSLSTAVNSEAEVATAGLLNPSWVEWLMGWPIGWTELKPLAMDKFHEWQRQHGEF